jgi:hypothetical protein
MKKVDILILLLIVGMMSCSEEIEPTPYTYSQFFSGKEKKTWVFESIILWEEGKSDISYTLSNCIGDDQYIFYADSEKKYEVTNGATKCASGEPDLLITDTWSFINGGATLTIILPFLSDTPLPYIVREVSNTDMLLEIFIDQENTQSYRIAFKSTGTN